MDLLDHGKFLELINKQEIKIRERFDSDFIHTMADEYVIDPHSMAYIKCLDRYHNGKGNEQIFDNIVSDKVALRQISELDISKHTLDERLYLHKHTFIEVDYVYKGRCKYYLDHKDNHFIVNEKQLCIVNQGITHGMTYVDESSIMIKCMIPIHYLDLKDYGEMDPSHPVYQLLSKSLNQVTVSPGFLMYQIEETDVIEEALYRLFYELIYQEVGYRSVMKNSLSDLFISLFREEAANIKTLRLSDEKVLNMAKVIAYIKANYKDVTLSGLAEKLSFNEQYLGRRIKAYVKKSFQVLLVEVRIGEAKRMLVNTDKSVKTIAQDLGYKSTSYFYKSFKEQEGITPVTYRNSHKEKE